MTPPVVRHAYFWSQVTGLMEFRDVDFAANETTLGLIAARPVARYTLDRPLSPALALKAAGAQGLLWTVDAQYLGVLPHIIPAILTGMDSMRRTDGDGQTLWDVRVEWRSSGPFVASGFSQAELVEAEVGE